ncbi:DUF2239 family protein [Arenibaculum sp.]|jgi:hypothetical protein|uniref:DUF2239 family protein n=1 Tax=Arenibaculum sp. TaxID=2865862 RepID=UPI002E125FDC|nr:DUF2239 family protein [Arenibaculum sp.]
MAHAPTCTAFVDHRLLAAGPYPDVAVAVRRALAQDGGRTILTFDDRTGRLVDFDLSGSEEDVAARLRPADEPSAPAGDARTPGRPRLGVVAREVTLLPRHWEWLGAQPGGASVTLRKLVDAARAAGRERDGAREAQAAADRFMGAMLGDAPGYEEAARALYAGDAARFAAISAPWPADLRDHARRLAAPAFATA